MDRENQATRQKIIQAALHTFARYGFGKATIKRIAGEAGLSTTSLIYWYFKDKNELFQAVLNETSPLVKLAAAPADLMDKPPEEVLPELARLYLDTFDDANMNRLLRIFLTESADKPEMDMYFARTGMMTVLNFLVAYLRKQVDRGRLRPHDQQSVVRSFMGALVIYVLSREILPPLRLSLPDKAKYAAELTEVYLRGLRP